MSNDRTSRSNKLKSSCGKQSQARSSMVKASEFYPKAHIMQASAKSCTQLMSMCEPYSSVQVHAYSCVLATATIVKCALAITFRDLRAIDT